MVVSMIILGNTMYLDSLSDKHEETIDYSGLNRTQARLDNMTDTTEKIESAFEEMTMREGITSIYLIPYDMIRLGWNSVKLVFGSLSLVGDIFTDATEISAGTGIPAPDWLLPTIIAIVLLLFLFIMIYAFFKWRLEI